MWSMWSIAGLISLVAIPAFGLMSVKHVLRGAGRARRCFDLMGVAVVLLVLSAAQIRGARPLLTVRFLPAAVGSPAPATMEIIFPDGQKVLLDTRPLEIIVQKTTTYPGPPFSASLIMGDLNGESPGGDPLGLAFNYGDVTFALLNVTSAGSDELQTADVTASGSRVTVQPARIRSAHANRASNSNGTSSITRYDTSIHGIITIYTDGGSLWVEVEHHN